MKNLTAEDLLKKLIQLALDGVDLSKVPVTLGDDEELNGCHGAYFYQMVDVNEEISPDYVEEQCKEALSGYDEKKDKIVEFNGKTFLIS